MGLILISGLWERAMLSLYLSGAAVIACAVLGGLLGLWAAVSRTAWAVILPICDMLQTIPLFVFLIPVLMFFQIGEFSAFLAIIAYAIVPMIRYTRHGLVNTPEEMIEAATSSGATEWQIMREVRGPYAAPTILLGLNQTILYAFSMLVIAALIGTTGLGNPFILRWGVRISDWGSRLVPQWRFWHWWRIAWCRGLPKSAGLRLVCEGLFVNRSCFFRIECVYR